ncbi:MAG: glycosyltransferase family 4 protein [Planctomycetota bacterium]|jgi:glycosyltransferase involved in cell wall biosynthesis
MSIRRLAVLSRYDPELKFGWSGIPFHILREMRRHFPEVRGFHPSKLLLQHARDRWVWRQRRWFNRYAPAGMNGVTLRIRGSRLGRAMTAWGADAVLAAGVDDIAAFLPRKLPLIHHSDTTFAAMRDYYPSFREFTPRVARLSENVARTTIQRAKLCLYPSRWAADSAIGPYGADDDKVEVVPYGANLDPVPERAQALGPRDDELCRLLMVARDWERKGGDIAVAVVEELDRMGVPARLTVIGNCPVDHPLVEAVGILNKDVPEQAARFQEHFARSHALLLPTRADCSAIVFAEAAAYGMPAFTTRTGGVPESVIDGETGQLFALDAPPRAYAEAIAAMWQEPGSGATMRAGARDHFERTLNWESWGRAAADAIRARFP